MIFIKRELPIAWVPKAQSSWMNYISKKIINALLAIGVYYRRYYGIREKHVNIFARQPFIQELPFGLIVKSTDRPAEESIATEAARAMGLPVARVLCYADYGPENEGHILMTRIPGETLWDVYKSYSNAELANIMTEVGSSLQRIRCFASPYGRAVCGPDGRGISTRAAPHGEWNRCESPEEYHDQMLQVVASLEPSYEDRLEEAHKIKTKSYRVVLAHGDLHPSNIMVNEGHLSGIIDWGAAGWYPEYWDFVHPMSLWPHVCQSEKDLLYKVPGGGNYHQECKSWHEIAWLGHYAFY